MGYINAQPSSEQTVTALNELLRGELAAVQSYDKALPAVEGEPRVRASLLECRASHEARAQRIREAVLQVGGEPTRDSGAWGALARSVSAGVRAMGLKTVVSTLEEGEDHGLKEYKDALPRLDAGLQHLISNELYPQQVRTHSVLSALKRVSIS
jgi:uncharacterized protein (TIGR02284 family)